MLEKVAIPKYFNPGSPVVTVTIHGIQVQNALVDLGASINVMIKEVLSRLHIVGLKETPTILQLTDSSTIKPYGMIEDVIVTLNSWEYLVDFVVLSLKYSMGGYPLILGRPWLATTYAYISCQSRKMTISNGVHTKNLTLYSLLNHCY